MRKGKWQKKIGKTENERSIKKKAVYSKWLTSIV